MTLLQYRARSDALAILRARGLSPSELSALVLPAIGPKWLVLSGFDRALIDGGFLDAHRRRLLLFGASVGAWRALALAARDPHAAHARLIAAYCEQRFTTADSPAAISGAYRRLIETLVEPADLAYAAHHPTLDLAIATARARWPLTSEQRRVQGLAFIGTALVHALHARASERVLERFIFATPGHVAAGYPLLAAAGGVRGVLHERNMREVALASGTVPLYMAPVRNPPEAPPGLYVDGGFSDYHLNRTATAGPGLTLLFLHQRRIVPAWFDKFLPWRKLQPDALARLLLVHPSPELVRSLPGGAVPTREDFERFVHEPELRIARWREVAARSTELAEQFMRDVRSGDIAARAAPF